MQPRLSFSLHLALAQDSSGLPSRQQRLGVPEIWEIENSLVKEGVCSIHLGISPLAPLCSRHLLSPEKEFVPFSRLLQQDISTRASVLFPATTSKISEDGKPSLAYLRYHDLPRISTSGPGDHEEVKEAAQED